MASFDIDAYLARTGALDVSDIAWDDVPKHPISAEAIRTLRYMQDIESHTIVYLRSLYYRQAEARLQRPAVARVARFLVDRFWAPVGSGVQPPSELRFMASYLFSDARGRAAAHKADETIRRLPGFATVGLLESWLDRFANGGTEWRP